MERSPRSVGAVTAVAVGLFLAACGSSDGTTSAPDPTATTTSAPVATDPTPPVATDPDPEPVAAPPTTQTPTGTIDPNRTIVPAEYGWPGSRRIRLAEPLV